MSSLSPLIIVCAALDGGRGVAIFDSGDPMPRPDGEIPFISVWRVLDAGDNLATRVIAPFELAEPASITAFSFFAFSPKDPAFKRIDIYADVSADSPGTLLRSIEFRQHQGAQQGWNRFELDQPLRLPAGQYGVAFHGNREFATFWAANAPIGAGYVWARPNEQANWAKVADAQFGFIPNFALRIFGASVIGGGSGGDPDSGGDDPEGAAMAVAPAVVAPAQYQYPRGRSPGRFHVLWRSDR